jgi:cell division transport system permease protein
MRQIPYLLVSGLRGLVAAPIQSLACILSLAISACVVLLFLAFGSLGTKVLDRAGTRASVLVYLKEEVPSDAVQTLIRKVQAHPDVDRVEYLSLEQDRARNAALLPRDVVSSLPAEAIPGQHCLDVALRGTPGRLPDIDGLTAALKSDGGVDIVAEPPVGAGRIRALASAVDFGRMVLVAVSALMLFATLFFVVSTLGRAMERRREEIAILRLLGATGAFVKVPVYVQGMSLGLIGAVTGAVSAQIVLSRTSAYLAGELGLGVRVDLAGSGSVAAAAGIGVLLGAFGAFAATRRKGRG